MYDLLLKGGTVVDPSQGRNEKLDVAITGNVISRVAPDISAGEASKVIDVQGKVVAPGFIDVHAHIFQPRRNPNHPDAAGVWGGVTTIADAGGGGAQNLEEFSEVVSQAQTKVYSFLSVFRDRNLPDDESLLDVDAIVKTAAENPGIVKGVKCLVQPSAIQLMGIKHVEAATTAAREAGLRVLMHIGDIGSKDLPQTPPELTAKAISLLSAGDIVTHIFTPLTGGAVDRRGKIIPELLEAQQRGVNLDPSYGDFNFGWDRAQLVMSQGVMPDTIGTDIDVQPGFGMRTHLMRGMLEYSAFFLELGFSMEEVVRMCTVAPAKALGIEAEAGSLAEGREADICVIDVVTGDWWLKDADGIGRTASKALFPFLTVKSGQICEQGEAPHAWGWGPPSVAEAQAVMADGN
jgi:dihydroorotase